MSASTLPPVVILPGLRGHVPDHWQTLLAGRLLAAGRQVHVVPPLGADELCCVARVAALERTLAAASAPPVLVAHSAGVVTAVHWAQQGRRALHAALLVTPPDFDAPLPLGYPDLETLRRNDWLPVPRARLPFRSIVAASRNDPLGRFCRVAALARAWGSELVDLGAVGHLNPASGYGEWPLAPALIRRLEALEVAAAG